MFILMLFSCKGNNITYKEELISPDIIRHAKIECYNYIYFQGEYNYVYFIESENDKLNFCSLWNELVSLSKFKEGAKGSDEDYIDVVFYVNGYKKIFSMSYGAIKDTDNEDVMRCSQLMKRILHFFKNNKEFKDAEVFNEEFKVVKSYPERIMIHNLEKKAKEVPLIRPWEYYFSY